MRKIILKGRARNIGKIALVDDEDFERVSSEKWYVNKGKHTEYAGTNSHIKGKARKDKDRNHNQQMHRFVLGLSKGDGKHVDHKDGNGLNNQKSNLRIVTNQQNCWNRINYKGFLGVSKCPDEGNAHWTVGVSGKYYGQYNKKKIAALVYDEIVRNIRDEFATQNFPNERLPKGFLIPNFNIKPRIADHRSGVSGVTWHKTKLKWRVIVKKKGFGYFKKLEDAIQRRKSIC